jgi:hypothetical protein
MRRLLQIENLLPHPLPLAHVMISTVIQKKGFYPFIS